MKTKDVIRLFFPMLWHCLSLALVPTAFNRRMIRGKWRRFWLANFRRRYVETVLLPRRRSACQRTGACCEMGFGCPAYDKGTRLCTIHPYKPLACQFFPITPEDIEERNLVMGHRACGYSFDSPPPKKAGESSK